MDLSKNNFDSINPLENPRSDINNLFLTIFEQGLFPLLEIIRSGYLLQDDFNCKKKPNENNLHSYEASQSKNKARTSNIELNLNSSKICDKEKPRIILFPEDDIRRCAGTFIDYLTESVNYGYKKTKRKVDQDDGYSQNNNVKQNNFKESLISSNILGKDIIIGATGDDNIQNMKNYINVSHNVTNENKLFNDDSNINNLTDIKLGDNKIKLNSNVGADKDVRAGKSSHQNVRTSASTGVNECSGFLQSLLGTLQHTGNIKLKINILSGLIHLSARSPELGR